MSQRFVATFQNIVKYGPICLTILTDHLEDKAPPVVDGSVAIVVDTPTTSSLKMEYPVETNTCIG